MMSFLVSLPRRFFLYVREVVYGEGHVWSTVEEAESGEDSGWSTSDEADGTQQRQRITCRPIPTKREKPPLPPKPKSPSIPAPAVSPTSEKSSHEENFQVAEDKPSKSYKRIPGPKGRQKATSYLTLKADDGGDVPH